MAQTVYRSKRDPPPPPKRSCNKLLWLTIFAAVSAVLYAVGNVLDSIKERWYIFDPETLHSIAQASIEAYPDDTAAMVEDVISRINEKYPDYAVNTQNEWVFNNAGGAMGAMRVIHASVTEYIIIFGTALGTEGHTGRHTADDYFNILVGEQWAWEAGSFKKEVYPPGSVHLLPRGHAKQYKMPDTCFALEYARGWIPPMLPLGFADAFTSTVDFVTIYHTVRITLREMVRNIVNGKI